MTHLLILTLLLPGQLRLPGDSPDPWYALRAYEKQEQPVTRRITHIFSPTLGSPALVSSGGTFALWTDRRPRKVSLIPSDGCGGPVPVTILKTTQKAGSAGMPPLFRSLVQLPAGVSRATYRTVVTWNDQSITREPNNVRCTGRAAVGDFSILLYSDHQLRDPSWKVFNGQKAPTEFPKRGESETNIAMTRQVFQEIELRDPDMVIHLGDLLFGLEFPQEYQHALDTWGNARFATWFIPGNHDGYATYSLRIPSSLAVGLGIVKCRSQFPSSITNYSEVFRYVVCLYGGLKEELFSNLVADGLVYWRNMWGPERYSFSRGKFHFIFLNTYSGTNRRRHSFSIFLKIKKLFLGAPGVDNYGGYLSDQELAWAAGELEFARKKGLTPVVLGHHDPRGNMDQTPFHENEPFPTSPIGIGHFEEWNYDGSWDSDPSDTRKKESATDNSGVRLLTTLAKYGGYYFSGHIHKDGQWHYPKGAPIAHGIKAAHDLTFVKVTTAASSRKDNGYWGYRQVTAKSDGTLDLTPFGPNMLSVPGGNIWAEQAIDMDLGKVTITTSLPTGPPVRLSLCLPANREGYKLLTPAGKLLNLRRAPSSGDDTKARYVFDYTPPPDSSPYSSPVTVELSLKPAKGNRPPSVKIMAGAQLLGADGKASCPTVLNAEKTTDPDGDTLHE
ncbi:metallophosphoesterase, partial [Myxococcota bacterium]|nr:metallophosphoesterase [Myxococcota bacterium]